LIYTDIEINISNLKPPWPSWWSVKLCAILCSLPQQQWMR